MWEQFGLWIIRSKAPNLPAKIIVHSCAAEFIRLHSYQSDSSDHLFCCSCRQLGKKADLLVKPSLTVQLQTRQIVYLILSSLFA